MVLTTEKKVRNTLGIQSEAVLPPEVINQFIEDAADDNNAPTDEKAERYLACYLIATMVSWDKVVSTGDGVHFAPPRPEMYHNLYKMRLRKLGKGKPKKVNYAKVDPQQY